MDITTAEAPDEGARRDGSSRRRLLTAGLSGAALAALVTRPAAAATEEDATTTTAAPKRPTDADVALLVVAQAAELAAFELYDQALAADEAAIKAGDTSSLVFDETARTALASIRQHHDAYAEALGGLLGRASITTADAAIVDGLLADFTSGDATTVATAGHGLEQTLVATHTELLGQIDGIDASGLIASVLVVEARHVTVLATLAGLDPVADIDAFVTIDAEPLSPAEPA